MSGISFFFVAIIEKTKFWKRKEDGESVRTSLCICIRDIHACKASGLQVETSNPAGFLSKQIKQESLHFTLSGIHHSAFNQCRERQSVQFGWHCTQIEKRRVAFHSIQSDVTQCTYVKLCMDIVGLWLRKETLPASHIRIYLVCCQGKEETTVANVYVLTASQTWLF